MKYFPHTTEGILSSNIVRAYIRALGGFGASGLGANGTNNLGTQWYTNGSLSFDGLPIFLANGLANNTGLASQTSNLHFATGLLNDMNEVKIIDMGLIDGSMNVRFCRLAVFKGSCVLSTPHWRPTSNGTLSGSTT